MLLNEDELIQKTSNGDTASFALIYDHYNKVIFKFIYKFVKSADLSDDLCQEIFLKIWENRENLAQVRSFKSYAYTVTKNYTFNFLKRAAVESNAKVVIYSAFNELRNGLEEDLITAEYLRYIKAILNTLPAQSREVFKLCRQQGKTYEETAALLGISRNCVKKHMVRSMKTLKQSVTSEFGISMSIFLLFENYFSKFLH